MKIDIFKAMAGALILLAVSTNPLLWAQGDKPQQRAVQATKDDLASLTTAMKIESLRKTNFALRNKNQGLKQKAKEYQKAEEEKTNLEKERKTLKEAVDRLSAYNAELKTKQARLDNYNSQLEAKAKELYIKIQALEQAKKDYMSLSSASEALNKERVTLKKQNEQLKNERAALYQELGVVYAQARLFDMAIDAYTKSLNINPNNAQAHYDIGILYKHSKDNSKNACII